MTKANGTKFGELNNYFGVPQGSILGPLLFIIYINGMLRVLKRCKIILYADDILIYADAETDGRCTQYLLQDINNKNNYLKKYKLKLNESKTKLLQINMNDDSVIKINNDTIEKVDRIKYIVFTIDNYKIELNKHIDYICKKVAKNWSPKTN